MKEHFFITGLPRARTSWLANFFTYNNSHCYHEATRFCTNMEDVLHTMNNHPAGVVGNADTALLFIFEDLHHAFPNAKFILIDRDLHETIDSFLGFYHSQNYFEILKWLDKLYELKNQLIRRYNFTIIQHEDLNEMETCKHLWEYLIPDTPFDEKRWNLLDELYINKNTHKNRINMLEDSIYAKYMFPGDSK